MSSSSSSSPSPSPLSSSSSLPLPPPTFDARFVSQGFHTENEVQTFKSLSTFHYHSTFACQPLSLISIQQWIALEGGKQGVSHSHLRHILLRHTCRRLQQQVVPLSANELLTRVTNRASNAAGLKHVSSRGRISQRSIKEIELELAFDETEMNFLWKRLLQCSHLHFWCQHALRPDEQDESEHIDGTEVAKDEEETKMTDDGVLIAPFERVPLSHSVLNSFSFAQVVDKYPSLLCVASLPLRHSVLGWMRNVRVANLTSTLSHTVHNDTRADGEDPSTRLAYCVLETVGKSAYCGLYRQHLPAMFGQSFTAATLHTQCLLLAQRQLMSTCVQEWSRGKLYLTHWLVHANACADLVALKALWTREHYDVVDARKQRRMRSWADSEKKHEDNRALLTDEQKWRTHKAERLKYDLPWTAQVYLLIHEAGTKGITSPELREALGDLGMKSLHPLIAQVNDIYGIKALSDRTGRQFIYRYYTLPNFEHMQADTHAIPAVQLQQVPNSATDTQSVAPVSTVTAVSSSLAADAPVIATQGILPAFLKPYCRPPKRKTANTTMESSSNAKKELVVEGEKNENDESQSVVKLRKLDASPREKEGNVVMPQNSAHQSSGTPSMPTPSHTRTMNATLLFQLRRRYLLDEIAKAPHQVECALSLRKKLAQFSPPEMTFKTFHNFFTKLSIEGVLQIYSFVFSSRLGNELLPVYVLRKRDPNEQSSEEEQQVFLHVAKQVALADQDRRHQRNREGAVEGHRRLRIERSNKDFRSLKKKAPEMLYVDVEDLEASESDEANDENELDLKVQQAVIDADKSRCSFGFMRPLAARARWLLEQLWTTYRHDPQQVVKSSPVSTSTQTQQDLMFFPQQLMQNLLWQDFLLLVGISEADVDAAPEAVHLKWTNTPVHSLPESLRNIVFNKAGRKKYQFGRVLDLLRQLKLLDDVEIPSLEENKGGNEATMHRHETFALVPMSCFDEHTAVALCDESGRNLYWELLESLFHNPDRDKLASACCFLRIKPSLLSKKLKNQRTWHADQQARGSELEQLRSFDTPAAERPLRFEQMVRASALLRRSVEFVETWYALVHYPHLAAIHDRVRARSVAFKSETSKISFPRTERTKRVRRKLAKVSDDHKRLQRFDGNLKLQISHNPGGYEDELKEQQAQDEEVENVVRNETYGDVEQSQEEQRQAERRGKQNEEKVKEQPDLYGRVFRSLSRKRKAIGAVYNDDDDSDGEWRHSNLEEDSDDDDDDDDDQEEDTTAPANSQAGKKPRMRMRWTKCMNERLAQGFQEWITLNKIPLQSLDHYVLPDSINIADELKPALPFIMAIDDIEHPLPEGKAAEVTAKKPDGHYSGMLTMDLEARKRFVLFADPSYNPGIRPAPSTQNTLSSTLDKKEPSEKLQFRVRSRYDFLADRVGDGCTWRHIVSRVRYLRIKMQQRKLRVVEMVCVGGSYHVNKLISTKPLLLPLLHLLLVFLLEEGDSYDAQLAHLATQSYTDVEVDDLLTALYRDNLITRRRDLDNSTYRRYYMASKQFLDCMRAATVLDHDRDIDKFIDTSEHLRLLPEGSTMQLSSESTFSEARVMYAALQKGDIMFDPLSDLCEGIEPFEPPPIEAVTSVEENQDVDSFPVSSSSFDVAPTSQSTLSNTDGEEQQRKEENDGQEFHGNETGKLVKSVSSTSSLRTAADVEYPFSDDSAVSDDESDSNVADVVAHPSNVHIKKKRRTYRPRESRPFHPDVTFTEGWLYWYNKFAAEYACQTDMINEDTMSLPINNDVPNGILEFPTGHFRVIPTAADDSFAAQLLHRFPPVLALALPTANVPSPVVLRTFSLGTATALLERQQQLETRSQAQEVFAMSEIIVREVKLAGRLGLSAVQLIAQLQKSHGLHAVTSCLLNCEQQPLSVPRLSPFSSTFDFALCHALRHNLIFQAPGIDSGRFISPHFAHYWQLPELNPGAAVHKELEWQRLLTDQAGVSSFQSLTGPGNVIHFASAVAVHFWSTSNNDVNDRFVHLYLETIVALIAHQAHGLTFDGLLGQLPLWNRVELMHLLSVLLYDDRIICRSDPKNQHQQEELSIVRYFSPLANICSHVTYKHQLRDA